MILAGASSVAAGRNAVSFSESGFQVDCMWGWIWNGFIFWFSCVARVMDSSNCLVVKMQLKQTVGQNGTLIMYVEKICTSTAFVLWCGGEASLMYCC